MKSHVLLVTSTNLAANPRIFKELQLLYQMKVKISFVGFHLHNWTDENESLINQQFPDVDYNYIDATRKNFLSWFAGTLKEKAGRFLIKIFPTQTYISALATGKRMTMLSSWLKTWKGQPDLIIGHNPAAFYPVYKFAARNNIPFALDIEDFHPWENNSHSEKRSVALIMKKLLPKTYYTSYASPLIKKQCDILVTNTTQGFVINNTFPGNDFSFNASEVKNEKLQLVWFSQVIDYGRGLEHILPVVDTFKNEIVLTLIGKCNEEFKQREIKNRSHVEHLAPMTQKELHRVLSSFHIGLAIEDPRADANRNICLTNKIWSYFQAGLYILASDTDAQVEFLETYPDHGITSGLNTDALNQAFRQIIRNKQQIIDGSRLRFEKARETNWETESEPLKSVWQKVLSHTATA